jgi:hypothetical protein
LLRECIAEAEKDAATDEYTEERLKDLAAFFETRRPGTSKCDSGPHCLTRFVKLGDKIRKTARAWLMDEQGRRAPLFLEGISVKDEITVKTAELEKRSGWVFYDADCVWCRTVRPLVRWLPALLRIRGLASADSWMAPMPRSYRRDAPLGDAHPNH